MAFSLGNVTVSGSGPYTYIIVPALGATNPTGIELPYFSFVQQIRPGGSAVLDEMLAAARSSRGSWQSRTAPVAPARCAPWNA
jgi:hypothetical protein